MKDFVEMKGVPGYEDRYAATKDGRVWSYKRSKFLSPSIDKDGYLKILLYNGQGKSIAIHRVILMTWKPVENMENLQVNHKDENKQNNNLDNLEWMTCKENINYGTGIQRGHESRRNKVRCIETGQIFESQKAVAEFLNHKSTSNISQHLNGKQKTCGGYHWEKIEGEIND